MKLTILAVVTLALGIGLVLGSLGYSQLTGRAGAAPSPSSVAIASPLDAQGNVKAHEQGTANVTGKVDVGNLPAVQDVNVVSATPQTGRLIELGTQTVSGGGSFLTPFADVSDCGRVTLMARSSSGYPTGASIENMSPDGTTVIAAPVQNDLGGTQGWGGSTYSRHNIEVVMPFMRLSINNGNTGTPTALTAWIWCVP
jgi:hypothetical protein